MYEIPPTMEAHLSLGVQSFYPGVSHRHGVPADLHSSFLSPSSVSCSVMFDSLRPHGLQPTRLLWLWDSPGKNTRVGSHSLLQGIFLTQRLQASCSSRWILYHLRHQGSLSPSRGQTNIALPWVPGEQSLASPVAQWVKNLPAMQGTQEVQVWSLGQKDPLEQKMATHSSILATNPMDWWWQTRMSHSAHTALPWVPGEQKGTFTINQTTWRGLMPQVNKDTFIRQDIPGVQRSCFRKQSRASPFFGLWAPLILWVKPLTSYTPFFGNWGSRSHGDE